MTSHPAPIAPIPVRRFIAAVYGRLPGFLDIRTLPPVQRTFVAIGDHAALEAFVKARRDRNVYVGVATRRSPLNGTLKNCGALPGLFADLDDKDFADEAGARASLANWPLPPSMVVRSGGGLQVWWLLHEPIDLAQGVNAAVAKLLLRRLATKLQADMRSAEPAHLLRLPNTLNFKYDPPRYVQLEVFEPARRYDLVQFDWLLAEEPSPVTAPLRRVRRPDTGLPTLDRARAYLATMPCPEIGCGSDRATLEAACRLVRGFALSAADAEDLLWEWCGHQGWSRAWVAEKIRNAERYGTEPIGGLL